MVADRGGAVTGAVVWLVTAGATATGAVELTLIDVLMARIHGTLNAFGFSLAGLVGWLVRDARAASDVASLP